MEKFGLFGELSAATSAVNTPDAPDPITATRGPSCELEDSRGEPAESVCVCALEVGGTTKCLHQVKAVEGNAKFIEKVAAERKFMRKTTTRKGTIHVDVSAQYTIFFFFFLWRHSAISDQFRDSNSSSKHSSQPQQKTLRETSLHYFSLFSFI